MPLIDTCRAVWETGSSFQSGFYNLAVTSLERQRSVQVAHRVEQRSGLALAFSLPPCLLQARQQLQGLPKEGAKAQCCSWAPVPTSRSLTGLL